MFSPSPECNVMFVSLALKLSFTITCMVRYAVHVLCVLHVYVRTYVPCILYIRTTSACTVYMLESFVLLLLMPLHY